MYYFTLAKITLEHCLNHRKQHKEKMLIWISKINYYMKSLIFECFI